MIRSMLMATTLLIAACATPYSLPADDRAEIAARIAGFERAYISGNTTEVINVVPPRMIATIARDGGISEQKLRREMAKLLREASRDIRTVSFGMALDKAQFKTTPTGRVYGLIPTQTVVQTPEGIKVQSNNQTLTLEDSGTWYLIRVDDARQIELMRELYPDFENVSFPKGTSKVIG